MVKKLSSQRLDEQENMTVSKAICKWIYQYEAAYQGTSGTHRGVFYTQMNLNAILNI